MESSETVLKARPAVIVMVKAPTAGQVKTRLCPPLSAIQAAELAACMAQDTVANGLRVTAEVLIAYAPGDGREYLESLLPPGLSWTRQKEGDLGERMQSAMEDAAGLRFSPLIVIGTDSPTMPARHLETALLLLNAEQADVVLCPAEDGGFSLIGVQAPVPGLFAEIAWSMPTTLAETLQRAESRGLRVARLPEWYDIDTPEDLARLYAQLRSDGEARMRAPQTWRWLEQHAYFNNRPYA